MKRACILFFYDNDGIADRYNFYNIEQLKTVCDYLLIVINGKLTNDSRNRLADVCDDMFVRKNEGFDSWAYKDGIEYIGYEGLKEYDELILTNNTMFGPLRPLKDVFAETENVKCDFWGLQMNYGNPTQKTYLGRALPWDCKPDAVITNFRVIRKNMLHSIEFKRYWQQLAPINDYTDAVYIGELQFSYDMTSAGFIMHTLDKGMQPEFSPSPTVIDVYDQISRLKIPYLRKRLFNSPLNHFTDYKHCDEPVKVFRYIKNHTDYNTDMILQNIIRTVNQYDFHHLMSLTKIIPSADMLSADSDNVYKLPAQRKTAAVFHCYYPECFGQYLPRLMNFPEGTDFYFTVSSDELENEYRSLTTPLAEKYSVSFIRVENRGRDASALLVGARDSVFGGKYDYVCFMHEICGNAIGNKFSDIVQSFSDSVFDNIAGSRQYIGKVLELFEKNPRMGMAVAPQPVHGNYFMKTDGDWGKNYKNVLELLEKNEINVPVEPAKPPIAPAGTVFWFRPAAIERLAAQLTYEDFPEEPAGTDGTLISTIERAYSYFAQARGYFSAVIMSSEYASAQMIFDEQILKKYHLAAAKQCGRKISAFAQVSAFAARKGAKVDEFEEAAEQTANENVYVKLSRSPFKSFMKKLVPHGLWEMLRRKKCEAVGEKYVKI